MTPLRLVPPHPARLPGYAAALARGWSPNTTRDVSGEQLAAIAADPAAFVADLARHEGGGTVRVADGTEQARLPARVFWMWDGAFCGAINLRFVPGTLDLPPHVSGHVGYAVVPWKQRQGIATRALSMLLPVAWALGLPRVLVTCDADNVPSRRVIEANGGVAAGSVPGEGGAVGKALFWVDTAG